MELRRNRWRAGLGCLLAASFTFTTPVADAAETAVPVNLARNVGVTAGSSALGFLCTVGSGPYNAIDGQASNIYNDKFCAYVTGAYITLTIDLRKSYGISHFVIKHAGAAGESVAFNTREFTIRTSNDGIYYVNRAIVCCNTASVTTYPMYPEVGRTARWVQLVIYDGVQNPGLLTDVARIYEVEVWGFA
jgi:hypothetical protein